MTAKAKYSAELKSEVEYGDDRAIRLLLKIEPETWKIDQHTATGHRTRLTVVATKRVLNDREWNDTVTISHRILFATDLLDWLKSKCLVSGLESLIWSDEGVVENDDRIALQRALLNLIDKAEAASD